MFTGIIQAVGRVRAAKARAEPAARDDRRGRARSRRRQDRRQHRRQRRVPDRNRFGRRGSSNSMSRTKRWLARSDLQPGRGSIWKSHCGLPTGLADIWSAAMSTASVR